MSQLQIPATSILVDLKLPSYLLPVIGEAGKL